MRITNAAKHIFAVVGLCLSSGTASAAMATSGNFQVTQGGSASYSIPINVPPGTAGMQPDLALTYDSQSGNGSLGVGWGVSGLPIITRCPQTIAQDGVFGSLNFDANDRYCLEGKRLVPKNDVSYDGYGSDGYEYRTELESYSKIVSYGSAGSGPAWFKVWTKDGAILEFGNTADSRVEALGKSSVRVWAVNKRSDPRSNEVTYRYSEDTSNGDYVIDEIWYAGNSVTGVAPNASVKFIYDNARPDTEALYVAGSKITQIRRLETIATRVGGATVREYRLAYGTSPSSNRSRLSEVKECAGGTCLAPLSFQWSGSAMNTVQYPVRTSSAVCANDSYGSQAYGGCNDGQNYPTIQYPDINGDGRADLCYRSDAGIRCYLADGNTWDLVTPVTTTICPGEAGIFSPNPPGGICNDDDNFFTIAFADFNGDGREDLVYRSDAGIRIHLSTGAGFGPEIVTNICSHGSTAYGTCNDHDNHYSLQYPDINGDGRADICFRADAGVSCILYGNNGPNTAEPILTNICANDSSQHGVCNDSDNYDTIGYADINNDGRDDLVYRGDQGMRVWYSTGTGFSSSPYVTTLCANNSTAYGGCKEDQPWRTLSHTDVTGDGVLDLCYRADAGFRCYAGTGVGWDLSEPVINTNICAEGSTAYACASHDNFITYFISKSMRKRGTWRYNDVNADGRSDLMYRGTTGMQIWLSTGTDFVAHTAYTICGLSSGSHGVCNDDDNYNSINFIDVTGNGVADLVYRGDQGIQVWKSQILVPDLLTQVTTGLGLNTTITYQPISDPSIYTKDTNAAYPVRDMQFSMQVVSAVASSNGIGGIVGTTHKYGGLKVDMSGRGLLGFRWMETTQTESAAKTRAEYRQDWPFIGLPILEQKFSSTRQIRRTQNTYSCWRWGAFWGSQDCTSMIGARYTPYASKRIDESWDLNGVALPSVTTDSEMDSFLGVFSQVTTSTSDGYSKVAVNEHTGFSNGSATIRLARSQVTSSAPGVPAISRTSRFVYNTFAEIARDIIEPDQSDLCLVTAHGRDSFGNQTSTLVRNCNGTSPEAAAPTGSSLFAARTSQVTYDSRGQFPTGATNGLGHAETRAFDARFGAVTSLTDPNGIAAQWEYDAYGRKTLEIRPDGNRTKTEYIYCSGINGGTLSCPTNAKYMIQVTPLASNGTTVNGPWVKTYFDMADRTVRTETVGFDGVKVVRADTQYDALARVSQKSRPYYASSSAYWTTFVYDDLGRTLTQQQPDGATTTYTYSGVTTTVKNALNQIDKRVVNSQGQVIQSTDADNKSVSYVYDAVGNLLKTIDPLGHVVEMVYDPRGRKVGMIDPDMGTWSYTYNALGEMVRQIDAKGQTASMVYDVLGRMTQRVEPDLTSNWYYDTYKSGVACAKGIGKLCGAESDNGYSRLHSFDQHGRPHETRTSFGPLDTLNIAQSFDANGRVASVDYPTLFGVKYVYSPLGYLQEARNKSTNAVYWRANSMDAEGHILSQSYGNYLETIKAYGMQNGRLMTLKTGNTGAPANVQNILYEYDLHGNVKKRSDLVGGIVEDFSYDVLNRLQTVSKAAGASPAYSISYGYDAIGNLTSRSDLGTYAYNVTPGAVGPHAVREISLSAGGKRVYSYDANGNMTGMTAYNAANAPVPAASRSYTINSYNLPSTVSLGGQGINFLYGPERQRTKQFVGQNTTTYLHPDNSGTLLYERQVTNTLIPTTEQRFYVMAAGQVVAIVTKNGLGIVTGTQYLHQDGLGSVAVVTNSNASVAERSSYEPFGKRRQPNGAVVLGETGPNSAHTNRGFTGHEHLEEVGLIHMNGRVFDPNIGRFVSPDPIVQEPHNLQSFNRYSYTINNPLRYTDPSGFSWWGDVVNSFSNEMRRWERDFRHEVRRPNSLLGTTLRIAGYTACTFSGTGPGCVAAVEAAVSRAQGVTGSQLVRNVVVATVSSEMFNAAGDLPAGSWEHLGAHAFAGCFQQAAGGGDCGQGAASAFLGAWTTVQTDGNFLAAVVAGGTGSVITGGRFQDGVLTVAMGYVFNHMAHFDGKQLKLYDDDGALVGQWDAVSGGAGAGIDDQSTVGWGPIPEGEYIARQSGLQFRSEQSLWGKVKSLLGGGTWPGGHRAWGDSRVWLEPASGTNTYGRSGFSIHGGTVPGSAGCIDLCRGMPSFTGQFRRAGHDVKVIVEY